jgi:hypothetical protein
MDHFAPWFPAGTGNGVLDVYAENDRHQSTDLFPIDGRERLTVEMTLYDAEYAPLWRTEAKLTTCFDNGKLKKIVNYKATNLLRNPSFENNQDGQPRYWKPNGAIASTPSGSTCAETDGPGFVGNCALEIVPSATAKTQKYTQVWTGSRGKAGDLLELTAVQLFATDYNGRDNLTAVVTFANGATTQLRLTTWHNAGNDYHHGFDTLIMPAPIVKAVVTIKEDGSTGSYWRIDGVALTIYAKSSFSPEPRSLPPDMN